MVSSKLLKQWGSHMQKSVEPVMVTFLRAVTELKAWRQEHEAITPVGKQSGQVPVLSSVSPFVKFVASAQGVLLPTVRIEIQNV